MRDELFSHEFVCKIGAGQRCEQRRFERKNKAPLVGESAWQHAG